MPASDQRAADVQVFTFGGFRVVVRGRDAEHDRGHDPWHRRFTRTLFKALVSHPARRLTREQALELLWPEAEPGANLGYLRTILTSIRRALAPVELLAADRETIWLDTSRRRLWVDADAYEAALADAHRSVDPLPLLREADALYVDDYLPEDLYVDWSAERRDRMRAQWISLQFTLADIEARDDVEAAEQRLRRTLARDPCNELAAEKLMRLLEEHGRRSDALQVYERVKQQLWDDLTVEPSRSLHELSARVRRSADNSALSAPLESSVPVARRDNLAGADTRLVGRVNELERIRRDLHDANKRLITLTGPCGVGKTRIAVEAARSVVNDFADGVWFVDLAGVTTGAGLATAILHDLPVTGDQQPAPAARADPAARLASVLAGKDLLLLLDNFEQLLDAAADLSQLLSTCPKVRMLVTSRTALDLHAEHLITIDPLPVPEHMDLLDVGSVARVDAVALFLERARARDAHFALTSENARDVVAICQRLEGLPLAIELAARRLPVLTLRDLLAGLDRPLNLLANGPVDRPDRHRSIRQTIDWSVKLLRQQRRRRLFRRLSVFAGGWTLESMERVCCADAPMHGDALEDLEALVEHSLVQRVRGPTNEARFHMLQTIRDYAREQLDHGMHAELWERYVRYFVARAQPPDDDMSPARRSAWFGWLESEYDNLRAILRGSLDRGDAEISLRLTTYLWQFWVRQGLLAEGAAWFIEALALGRNAQQPDLGLLATAYVSRAELACAQGNLEGAITDGARSLNHFRVRNDARGLSRAHHVLGWALANASTRDLDAAEFHQRTCLELDTRSGSRQGQAKALHELGEIQRQRQQYVAARESLKAAIRLRSELADQEGLAWSHHCLAWVDYDERRYDQAWQSTDAALGIWQRIHHRAGFTATYALRARIAWRTRDPRASTELVISLRAFPLLRNRAWLAFDLQTAAALVFDSGELSGMRSAARLLGAAETLASPQGLHGTLQAELREIYDRMRRLDRTMSATAFAEGRQLEPEQALDEALQALSGQSATSYGTLTTLVSGRNRSDHFNRQAR